MDGNHVGADGNVLFVFGAGWFAVEVAGWAEDAGWEIGGLVELVDAARAGSTHQGYRVVDAAQVPARAAAIVAGGGDRRAAWQLAEDRECAAATIVHPSAHISRWASLSGGTIVAPMAVLGAHTVTGRHVLLNRGTLIGHHVRIGEFANLMPGANIAGHAALGDDVTVGMGATIADHVEVGEGAVVGAGAVVLRAVAAATRVQGVPARLFEPPDSSARDSPTN